MEDNPTKVRLILRTMEKRHLFSMKGPQGLFREDLAAYQLVGGVIDHQGYDG